MNYSDFDFTPLNDREWNEYFLKSVEETELGDYEAYRFVFESTSGGTTDELVFKSNGKINQSEFLSMFHKALANDSKEKLGSILNRIVGKEDQTFWLIKRFDEYFSKKKNQVVTKTVIHSIKKTITDKEKDSIIKEIMALESRLNSNKAVSTPLSTSESKDDDLPF